MQAPLPDYAPGVSNLLGLMACPLVASCGAGECWRHICRRFLLAWDTPGSSSMKTHCAGMIALRTPTWLPRKRIQDKKRACWGGERSRTPSNGPAKRLKAMANRVPLPPLMLSINISNPRPDELEVITRSSCAIFNWPILKYAVLALIPKNGFARNLLTGSNSLRCHYGDGDLHLILASVGPCAVAPVPL